MGPSGDAAGSIAPASTSTSTDGPASDESGGSTMLQSPKFVKRLPKKYQRRVRTEREVETAAAVYLQSAWRSHGGRKRFRRDMEQRQKHLNSFHWPMFVAVMFNFVANATMNQVPRPAHS